MKLIGINGFKRSGKGEVYNSVARYGSMRGERAAGKGYADKLKQYAALSLGYKGTPKQLFEIGDALKLDGVTIDVKNHGVVTETITGRQYLQHVGNEARNLFGDYFWVDQVTPLGRSALKRVWEDTRYSTPDYACITDLRYPNEAERVHELGGFVIEVLRPGTASDGHASEQPLPTELVDYVIHNDATLYDLAIAVEDVLNAALRAGKGEVQC